MVLLDGGPEGLRVARLEVLDAARESWGLGTQQCDAAPITVRVVVTAGEEAAPEPALLWTFAETRRR